MSLIEVSSYIMFAVIVGHFVDLAIQKKHDWKESLRRIAIYGVGVVLFFYFVELYGTAVNNLVVSFIGKGASQGKKAHYVSIALIVISFAGIWYAANRWVNKNKGGTAKTLTALGTVNGAILAYFLYTEGVTGLSQQSFFFVFASGIVLLIATVVYWRSGLIDKLGVFLGYLVLNANWIYIWYLSTGINLLTQLPDNGPLAYGPWLGINGILLLYALPWDKQKIFFARTSYKAMNVGFAAMLAFYVYAAGLNFINATSKEQWEIKQADNLLILKHRKLAAEKELNEREPNGYDFARVKAVATANNATLDEVLAAREANAAKDEKVGKILADIGGVKPTWDVERAKIYYAGPLGWVMSLWQDESPTPGGEEKAEVVFTKTLTMADADKKAHVVPFVWGQVDVRVGDTIHVKVRDAKGVQKNVKFGLFRSKKICDIYENEKTINVVEIPKSGYKFKIALDDEIDNIAELVVKRIL
jgi:hypothetical protein